MLLALLQTVAAPHVICSWPVFPALLQQGCQVWCGVVYSSGDAWWAWVDTPQCCLTDDTSLSYVAVTCRKVFTQLILRRYCCQSKLVVHQQNTLCVHGHPVWL